MSTFAKGAAFHTSIETLRQRVAELEETAQLLTSERDLARDDLLRNCTQTNRFSNQLDDEKAEHDKTKLDLASARVRIAELEKLVTAADDRAAAAIREREAYNRERRAGYQSLPSLPPELAKEED